MKHKRLMRIPYPLWLKICLALLCTMFLVMLVAIQLDQKYRQYHLTNELEQQSYLVLKLISAGAQEAVIMEDIALLDTLVRETATLDPNLTSILIANESGQPMTQWRHSEFGKIPSTPRFEQSIEYEGELFGKVFAQWNIAGLSEEIDIRIARSRQTLMIALLALTVFSLILLHVLVASPINKLTAKLWAFSNGRYNGRLEIPSSREMSMLADAVNDLGTAMQESQVLTNKLEHRASHDSLTGLKNRQAFESALCDALEQRTESSPDDVLIYFDLDQFKVVNDTCGHAAGDELLKQLCVILSGLFDPDVMFARLGGDEFAVLLRSTSLEKGIQLAEELRVTTQAYRYLNQGRSFVVAATLGVVCITDTGENPERIMSAADETCYAAKDAGRNRVHVYTENDNELRKRRSEMSWVPKIHHALETSKFTLFGQIIESTDKSQHPSSHIEVLVRMLDNNGDVIPPGAFLPAAERYAIMPQIDRWVVINTLSWMEERLIQGDEVPVCAINLSGNSVSDEMFRDFLLEQLLLSPVPASSLCFEMTETAAVSDLSSAAEFMNIVRESGCQIALDDFGSGMSSFAYLKNLPVDFVKIDGVFVSPLMTDETCVVMVRAIGEIARVMGIKTIAEFVEDDEVRGKLADIGIDYVQGYGVGKPTALENFNRSVMRKAA